MNILVISPVDPRNAAHNRLHDLLGQLIRNHSVDLISTYGWWLKENGKRIYDRDYHKGEIETILTRVNLQYLSRKRMNPIIQELMPIIDGKRIIDDLGPRDYDLILNYNSILSGFLFARMFPRTPMIMDIADDLATMASDSPMVPRGMKSAVKHSARMLIAATIKRSAAVTVTTLSLADCFRIPENKMVLMPNAVNPNQFRRASSEKARKRFGLEGRFVIGYVGVLREWVDFQTVLEALAKLKLQGETPYIFIVGGEGDIDKLRSDARVAGVHEQIVTTGTLPYSEVPEALSAMDIGLIPFKLNSVANNALPLKLFEYLSCGVPVISQRLAPVVDAVGDNVLYASNATELCEKVQFLISNPHVRNVMADKGVKIIKENWSWDGVGERLEQLISTTVGGSNEDSHARTPIGQN